jgi:hypothetical protein
MSTRNPIPLIVLLFVGLALAQVEKQNGEECSCFLTNGSSSSYFTNHRFYDFQNVQINTTIPPLVTEYNNASNLQATSEFFIGDPWNNDWSTQTWNNSDTLTPETAASGGATVLMLNSANNIYIRSYNHFEQNAPQANNN